MKPLVNLSSAPFRNRRLFWLAIALIFVVSSLVGFRTLGTINDLDKKIVDLQPQVEQKEKEAKKVQQTGTTVPALSTEQTLSMMAARDLIQRKTFSWSQLLNEMEQLIPLTVRVRKITVGKIEEKKAAGSNLVSASTGDEEPAKKVALTVEVTGRNYAEVIRMIDTFNHTGHFEMQPKAERVLEGTDEVEFDLSVIYQPPVVRRASRAVPGNQVAEGGR
ncbi:MAG TPA: hypothetical protein VFD58_05465 [Blastocatellia bacterium]|nr:hypothetical protein [Blastocatellia bacterium]